MNSRVLYLLVLDWGYLHHVFQTKDLIYLQDKGNKAKHQLPSSSKNHIDCQTSDIVTVSIKALDAEKSRFLIHMRATGYKY
jgi:hypothetical protein